MLYSDKLMQLVNQIASPIVSTSTTTGTNTTKGTTTSTGTGTTKANEGLDLSSLMMLLALSGMFNKPANTTPVTVPATTGIDTTPLARSTSPTAPSSGLDPMALLRLLANLRV